MAEFVFLTDKGKRENQEDFYGNVGDEFFVVADGLGGHVAGEVAAKVAVEKVLESYKSEKDLKKIFDEVNKEVIKKAKETPDYFGMGTTMVIAVLQSNEVTLANVGDSRGYVFSDGKLQQASKDDRNIMGFINQALGIHEDVYPSIKEVNIKTGNLVLLCTDGLTDFVKENVVEKILASEADLKSKAQGLIDAALQFGSTDNVTVCLIRV